MRVGGRLEIGRVRVLFWCHLGCPPLIVAPVIRCKAAGCVLGTGYPAAAIILFSFAAFTACNLTTDTRYTQKKQSDRSLRNTSSSSVDE